MTQPLTRAEHLGAAETNLRRSGDFLSSDPAAQTYALRAIAHASIAALLPARTPRKDPAP